MSRETAELANVLKAIFQKYDADGNGIICRSEMRDVLTNLGLRQQIMGALMNAIDVNGDGQIDFYEFVDWIMHEGDGADEIRDRMKTSSRPPEQYERVKSVPTPITAPSATAASASTARSTSNPHQTFRDATQAAGSMKRSFQKFDADGNGTICRSEMRDVLTNLGLSQRCMGALMDAIDVNRDGKIDYNEFVDWVSSEGDGSDDMRDRMRSDRRGRSDQRRDRDRAELQSTSHLGTTFQGPSRETRSRDPRFQTTYQDDFKAQR
mmetsp:Transcript_67470/g.106803  ORF Transcript_67470/g.106803 Transcript_67470/m.106803 type:complete len:265 (-) Transcript_67470:46-840(-)